MTSKPSQSKSHLRLDCRPPISSAGWHISQAASSVISLLDNHLSKRGIVYNFDPVRYADQEELKGQVNPWTVPLGPEFAVE